MYKCYDSNNLIGAGNFKECINLIRRKGNLLAYLYYLVDETTGHGYSINTDKFNQVIKFDRTTFINWGKNEQI